MGKKPFLVYKSLALISDVWGLEADLLCRQWGITKLDKLKWLENIWIVANTLPLNSHLAQFEMSSENTT